MTGGSGFVGRHLAARLRADFPAAELSLPDTDITDAAAVDAMIASLQPDACIHLAAVSAVPAARQDPLRAWQVNLIGTLSLARALLTRSPAATLLFVSTAEVYGGSFRSGLPADEATLLAPANTYAATKAAADLALGAMVGEGLRIVRARPFNHTGPGQSENFVVAAFARQVARIVAGQQPPVLHVGALDPQRDFLDVRDVCAAYSRCLAEAEALPRGAILNIASGVPQRIGDILTTLLGLAGVQAEVAEDGARLRPTDTPIACGNAALAARLLGWQPVIPWTQTLQDVLDDWRERIKP